MVTFAALLAACRRFAVSTVSPALRYLAGIMLMIDVRVPLAENMPISLALSRQW